MNPETRYTNRFRKWLKARIPQAVVVKISDRFNSGISDLMIGLPNRFAGTAYVFPVEVKYINAVVKKKRKINLTDLQLEYLKQWHNIDVTGYILVGSKQGSALYTVNTFTGEILKGDIQEDEQVWETLTRN